MCNTSWHTNGFRASASGASRRAPLRRTELCGSSDIRSTPTRRAPPVRSYKHSRHCVHYQAITSGPTRSASPTTRNLTRRGCRAIQELRTAICSLLQERMEADLPAWTTGWRLMPFRAAPGRFHSFDRTAPPIPDPARPVGASRSSFRPPSCKATVRSCQAVTQSLAAASFSFRTSPTIACTCEDKPSCIRRARFRIQSAALFTALGEVLSSLGRPPTSK